MADDDNERSALNKGLRRAAIPILGTAIFLAVWEAACRLLHVRTILVPPPSLVAIELAESPLWFAQQSFYTLAVTLAGFALATVLGILFAVVITEWKLLDRLLFPLFVALNSVPKVALAPLFIIWFGTGSEPKVAIAFLIAIFAIVIDAALGLRSVPPDTLDLAKTLGGSRLKVLTRIKIFCAMPHIFAGAKVAMSLALVGAIVGEFVSSQRGLGYVILSAQGTFDTPRVFAAIAILAVLGLALVGAIGLAERLALPWHHSSGHYAEQ
jgi:NitT/TauT family transport system permease protein